MKILVTGAAGFIGSHLCERLLQDGHDVTGVDCFTDYYPPSIKRANIDGCLRQPRFALIETDLNTVNLTELVAGKELVFHLAAQAGVRASWGRDFQIYTETNILLTQRLLEAAIPARLNKFIYASSSSVYGDAVQIPMTEDAVLRPVSPYGVSKLAGEHLAALYWRNFGVPTVSLRFFTVYGPRQRPDMAFHKFLRAILAGRQLPLFGDGQQTRDFTFVSDVIDAAVNASLIAAPGSVFNIGGGHRVTMQHVLELIERITGKQLRVRADGEQKGDMRHTAADISRARDLLGYAPKFDLEQGLALEWNWLQQAISAGALPPLT